MRRILLRDVQRDDAHLAFWDFTRNAWNQPVVAELERFFGRWTALGVDGFRIDAARHFVEGATSNRPGEPRNLELLRNFLRQARTTKKGISFVAEAWTDTAEIETYLPDATDMVLAFPFMHAVREGLDWNDNHANMLRDILRHYAEKQAQIHPGARVVFSGNHDVPRLYTQFAGNFEKIRMAHFLTLLAPQVPLLFYGEEVAMEGKVKRPGPEPADPSSETEEERRRRLEEYVRTDRAFPWDGSDTAGFPSTPAVMLPENRREFNLVMRADRRRSSPS